MKVFLLAHQDDEIFFLPYLLGLDKKLIIYLTNGVSAGSSQSKLESRSLESELVFKKYLSKFNVQVLWLGLQNSIPDGNLHTFICEDFLAKIQESIEQVSEPVSMILTTTFEGAHQDHDSAAVISRQFANLLVVPVIEISTYRQWLTRIYSFKVLKPQFPLKELHFRRLKTSVVAFRLMLAYKTQKKTWMGLGPATLISYIFRGYQPASPQPVGVLQKCFYSFRGRATQEEVLHKLL